MVNSVNDEIIRGRLIEDVTDELPVLRVKMGISQERLSELVGISRQTYSAIETKKRKMSWSVFLALIAIFGYNESTSKMLAYSGIKERLEKYLKYEKTQSA